MTSKEIYDQAKAENRLQIDIELINERLSTGPKTGRELFKGLSNKRANEVQSFMLGQKQLYEYTGQMTKKWAFKSKTND